MNQETSHVQYNTETILQKIVHLLEDLTSDWDLELPNGIRAETRLIADLAFESIDVVQLIVVIQERFMRRDLPFEKLLMINGRYVEELRVEAVVDFLHKYLNP